jgi:WhiB family redox-sensing transcriptional regulator
MNLIELFRLAQEEDKENPLEWQREALCSQTDPELFFPYWEMNNKDAKAICQECPVKQKCFDYAVSNNETNGVWGGVDFTERRVSRRITNDNGHQGETTRFVSFWASEFKGLTKESRSV